MPWSSSRGLGALALVLACACGSSATRPDAGAGVDAAAGLDGGSFDASDGPLPGHTCPTDASLSLVDAEQWDAEPAFDGGFPLYCGDPADCPREQPFCCPNRCTECDFPPECRSVPDNWVECVERPPGDAIPSDCLSGTDVCSGDQPLCCEFDTTEVCTNRRPLRWRCGAGCL